MKGNKIMRVLITKSNGKLAVIEVQKSEAFAFDSIGLHSVAYNKCICVTVGRDRIDNIQHELLTNGYADLSMYPVNDK